MNRVFAHTTELAERTSRALADFRQTYPQFAFDADLLQPAESFVTRGKLFRGSICLLVASLLAKNDTPSEGAWSAAMALELAGSAILIQDDVMDAAELRRDLPTLHRQFAKHWHGKESEQARFGESVAICVSDVLFFVANKIVAQAKLPSETKLRLLDVMGTEIGTLAFAQAEELRVSGLLLTDPSITEETIIKIMVGKTARYTAMWPLQFGSLVADASVEVQKALARYGEAMGLVFQLSDDRLGLFGDPTKTGKDADSDVKTGKKTLYALYARNLLKGEAAQTFSTLYGKADLSAAELQHLQTLLRAEGIEKAANMVTERYATIAKQAAAQLTDYPELADELAAVIDFLLTRER